MAPCLVPFDTFQPLSRTLRGSSLSGSAADGSVPPVVGQALGRALGEAAQKDTMRSGMIRVIQTCKCFEHYLPAELWAALEADTWSVEHRINLMAKQMYNCGLVSPNVDLYKKALAIVQGP